MLRLVARLIKSLVLIGIGIYIGHNLIPQTIESIGDAPGFDGMLTSAKAGNAQSQFFVSEAFQNGRGVDHDAKQALYWLKESAANGYVRAQLELANHYEEGVNVPQDKAAALEIYQKVAADAVYRLSKTNSALF